MSKWGTKVGQAPRTKILHSTHKAYTHKVTVPTLSKTCGNVLRLADSDTDAEISAPPRSAGQTPHTISSKPIVPELPLLPGGPPHHCPPSLGFPRG